MEETQDMTNEPASPAPAASEAAVPAASEAAAAAEPAGGKPKKSKRRFWNIVMAVSSVVLVCSLVAIGVITYSYMQGEATYNELAGIALGDQASAEALEGKTLADLKVDWAALQEINPDVVAWVYVPGTMINYPVVQGTDNDKYLHEDFNGNRSYGASFGTIFMDCNNSGDFTDAVNIMYGHNMNNGSMFAALSQFSDAEFFNSHRTIYILTPQGNYRLETFSIVHASDMVPLTQFNFTTNHDRNAYVSDQIVNSDVQADPAVGEAYTLGTVFMLATCDNILESGRWLLYGSVVESTVPQDVTGAKVGSDGNKAVYVDDQTIEGLGKN